jgi:uncharacterized repeat protein (TIGR01451 family)
VFARGLISLAAVVLFAAPAASANTLVETVPGTIVDVQPAQLLYLENAQLKIEDRQTGAVTPIPTIAGKRHRYGFLSPHGAIFDVMDDQTSLDELWEWRDGTLIRLLGSLNSQLTVKGDYALFSGSNACCSYSLFLRDLATGTTTTVATNAGNTSNDLTAGGEVAYWTYPAYDIYRWRNGVATQLTNDATLWDTYPLTDGTHVVYRKHSPCCQSETGSVAFSDGTTETVLDSFRNGWPGPPMDYAVASGFIAFTHLGTQGELQVWRRDPSGTQTQVSPAGIGARIVSMNGLGEVVFYAGGRLYLAKPGASAYDVGAAGAQIFFWQNGDWFMAVGGSLYVLDRENPYADLSITKTDLEDPVSVNETIHYHLEVRENGPRDATNVALTDPLPAGVGYQSATPSQGSCGFASGKVSCLLGSIAAGSSATVDVDVIAQAEGTITNTASVTGDPSVTGTKRSATATTTVGPAGYPRPKGATPLVASLVPAFLGCRQGNRIHAQPLAYQSCAPPAALSRYATVGTPDANRAPANATGLVALRVLAGDPGTTADEADVAIAAQVTDVRNADDLTDYAGELQTTIALQITDKYNGPSANAPATVSATTLAFTVPCATTADGTIGSTCALSTSADSLVPDMVREGKRTTWQLGQVQVTDGGEDGVASTTTDNTLFMKQGVFIP